MVNIPDAQSFTQPEYGNNKMIRALTNPLPESCALSNASHTNVNNYICFHDSVTAHYGRGKLFCQ